MEAGVLSQEEICRRIRIEQSTLQLWIDEAWLVPRLTEAGLLLSEVDLARAGLIRHLRGEIGVNDEGVGIILNLIDQVHGLRSVVQALLARGNSVEGSSGA
jgi:chaperone modulatory protein CbpM